MVAIVYNSDQMIANGGAGAQRVHPNHGSGGDTKTYFFKAAFTAAPLITDIMNLGWVPKGLVVTGCTITATDMDSSTGILIDVGDAADIDRIVASSAVGQANTLKVDTIRPSALTSGVVTLGFGYKYLADTLLIATVSTAPSGTGAVGTLLIAVSGVIQGVAS